MARYVRCIEGHVFNAEASATCPKCGASFLPATVAPGGSIGDATGTSDSAVTQGLPIQGLPMSVAGLIGMIGIGALLAYIAWPSGPPDIGSSGIKEERQADAAPASNSGSSPSASRQPPEEPADLLPAEPPSRDQRATETDVAQKSLTPAERDKLNQGYAALLDFLRSDKKVDTSTFSTLPWSPATMEWIAKGVAPEIDPDVKAAAEHGRWSQDAIEVAMVIGGYKSAQTNDIPHAVRQLEAAIRLGSPVAPHYLGITDITYQHPLLRAEDAVQWFKLSADRGVANSAYRVAQFYRDAGKGAEQQEMAARYFRLAVEHSDPDAIEMAVNARRGNRKAIKKLAQFSVGPKEALAPSTAVYNMRSSFDLTGTADILFDRARTGDATALVGLFFMARDNEVLSISLPAQAQILRAAARRTNHLASLNLAEYLLAAEPAEKNISEAAFWFAAAAAMSDSGSSDLKHAATRYAEAVSKLPADQAETITTLIERIVPEARTGR